MDINYDLYFLLYYYIMKPTQKKKLRFAVNSRIITRRRIKGVLKSGGSYKRRRGCTRRK